MGTERLKNGYLILATWRGIPIRVHWTAPIGALVFSGLRWAPGFWLGFFAVILLHELGHAVLVRRFGARPVSVDLLGFGGLCRWYGSVSDRQRCYIAWGGVVTQALVAVIAFVVLAVVGPPRSIALVQLADAFTTGNLINAAYNLLPFPPLDGARAWPILKLWYADLVRLWRRNRRRYAVVATRAEIERLDHLEPRVGRSSSDVQRLIDDAVKRTKSR